MLEFICIIPITIPSIVLVVAGIILSVAMLYGWIRDARREFDELPADHGH